MKELETPPRPQSIPMGSLGSWVGKEIGTTDWIRIDQTQIDQFAACTKDQQWIHVDPERAQSESPFGQTIGHGYLTLSLLSYFVEQCLDLSDANMAINYGLNRVRFPHPVPVNSRLRARIELKSCEEIEGGIQYILGVTVELEGANKPACVAEPIFRALY